MNKRILVRTRDRYVFEVDAKTLEAVTVCKYDPYCFSDLIPGYVYMDYEVWDKKREKIVDMT